MTKPQLGSLTNFNSSANTVNSETLNDDSNLFNFGIPLTALRENIGYKPPFKVIDLAGEFRGTESEIKEFVEEIESQKEPVQSSITYTSAINKDYTVKINNFTYVTAPNTNRVGWTMQLYDETL